MHACHNNEYNNGTTKLMWPSEFCVVYSSFNVRTLVATLSDSLDSLLVFSNLKCHEPQYCCLNRLLGHYSHTMIVT